MASIGRVLVLAVCLAAVTASAGPKSAATKEQVKIWEEPLVLPSYRVDPPDPSPMFYTGASYQGAQKRIYPYPLIDRITGIREEGTWKSLNLENEYIRLSVLPEIGGRLFSAVDKTNNYDIFYRQHVIKPALIGMLGAWISGGIEWCVFHHHRNTTYMPVDYTLADNPDGSKTIWFGETERRHRMRWIIGITLYPDKSYIEATVKMFNRTAVPNSILYWANVAVHVNDDYQVIFPPSVQVATYHSKNDFSYWPIGQGRYRGTDYKGVDLSWWKNHPNAVSFFAWDRQEDFMGGYDHGRDAGVASIGDHHVVTGAKLWEWGPNNIWDTKVLTDSDGPYAELMVGAFSDNQPDYSWIKPYEVKVFKQYWYPIRGIGGMKNANLDAAVNLELDPNGLAKLGFNATSQFKEAKVLLVAGDKTILKQTINIGPDKPYVKSVKVPEGTQATSLKASLLTSSGRTLVSYQPKERPQPAKLPDIVKAPPAPKDIEKVEDLYLTGLRLEQICNPSVDPFDYYREALKRDPNDSRTNTIVGVNYNKRGMYPQAEEHLRRAIGKLTTDYTRPVNTEAYYHLGLALKGQGRLDEAYDAFFRSTWDYAFHSAGYFQLATLSSRKRDFAKALEQIDQSLSTNTLHTKAAGFRAAMLRKLGRSEEATVSIHGMLAADPLDFLAMNETCLSRSKPAGKQVLARMKTVMRDDVQSYLELAADYMDWGLWDEAIEVLQRPVKDRMQFAGTYPMVYYYLGYLYEQKGQAEKATEQYRLAAKMPADYCFPFRLESADVLKAAIKAQSLRRTSLLLSRQPALRQPTGESHGSLGEVRVVGCHGLAVVHRNLGWGYFRHDANTTRAIASYEKAIACTGRDAGYYLELDDLYERANASPEKRLKLFEDNHNLIAQRKPLLIREIALLIPVGKYDRAIDLLTNNQFYTSEGGGRELHDTYVDAHLLRGLAYAGEKQYEKALEHFQQASEYPDNLAIERPENDRRGPQVAYLTATAYAAMGQTEQANKFYTQATTQEIRFGGSEARFYQAMAMRELGQKDKADGIFKDLVATGTKRISGESDVDFFAKFGEQQTRQGQRATAHYELGLGLLGQGRLDEARNQFEQALNFNAGYTWARYHLASLKGK